MPTTQKNIKVAAIGDLLLTAHPNRGEPDRGLEALSPEIKKIFAESDIVLANLECTLPSPDKVSTEPRVFSSIEQIRGLQDAGINLVTMGNNHCFDGGERGFVELLELLDQLEIDHFGAGLTISEAAAPTIIEVNGISVAFLAVVDKSSGMHRFADTETSGVALLDQQRTCRQIRQLSKQVDHIIISPHWGEERFRLPAPNQIDQARAFISSGATAVIGHHPHVLQGMDYYEDCPVIYSLSNFFANDVYWENGDSLTWNRFERTGGILLLEMSKEEPINIQLIPVYDNGETLDIERRGFGEKYIQRANKLLEGVTDKKYSRERFRVRALLPIINHLKWAELKRIRPKHFRKLLDILFNRNH